MEVKHPGPLVERPADALDADGRAIWPKPKNKGLGVAFFYVTARAEAGNNVDFEIGWGIAPGKAKDGLIDAMIRGLQKEKGR